MKKLIASCMTVLGLCLTTASAVASPPQDQEAFQNYFRQAFPKVKRDDFVNGPYALDAGMRAQWQDIMQFPPYSFAVDSGKELFGKPLADGKHYSDCFDHGGIGIRQTYPRFDTKSGRVVTLESAINACRQAHGDKPLPWEKGDLAAISAYMASTSDGKPFAITVTDDPRAQAAYERGKEMFYSRRGQLNFSCASCHLQNAGRHLRSEVLAPALGIVASFPLYRSKWGDMGTIDRRFSGCFAQVRAKPLAAQSEGYRDLEYFLTYMSNGLPVAGPGARP